MSEFEYGSDIALDEELESALQVAESQTQPFEPKATGADGEQQVDAVELMDIEDLPEDVVTLSPFEQFRKKGYLSVSDLVGTVWCEVQYDYRLRTLPYLPPSERPAVIKSDKGKEIVVDKAKVEGKERILRRGEKIHKRLEREIHPQEIVVKATTREDVWGLRFLNMLSGLEALITLGKCRELPVVGFIDGVLVMGIIDELTRKPIEGNAAEAVRETRSARQTALTSFFSPTKPRPAETLPRPRTHKVYVSDSKTRASGTLPNDNDTLAGRLQCMVYKELLDAMLLAAVRPNIKQLLFATPTTDVFTSTGPEEGIMHTAHLPSATPFSFTDLFEYLSLDATAPFTDSFLVQSKPVVEGNALRWGADQARCLDDMLRVWSRYVEALGLGEPWSGGSSTKDKGKTKSKESKPEQLGRTEERLELVYRRAGPKKEKKREKRRKGKRREELESSMTETQDSAISAVQSQLPAEPGSSPLAIPVGQLPEETDEGTALQSAIAASLLEAQAVDTPMPLAVDSEAISSDTSKPTIADIPTAAKRLGDELPAPDRTSDEEKEEDELAWAIEMSLAGDDIAEPEPTAMVLPLSQSATTTEGALNNKSTGEDAVEEADARSARSAASSRTPSPDRGTSSGTIIGRHRFQHDPKLLQVHLTSVLQFWMGQREPEGVAIHQASRCGWCEFEEGCEWRAKKAEEAMIRARTKSGRLN